MSSRSVKADEKVQVTVRCRPTNQSERQHRVKKVIECNNKAREVSVSTSTSALGLTTSQQTKVYNFDRVFGPNTTQLEVYKNVVESQLRDVLAGYNCTVLAYGQTGTGKTYTMEGERTIGEDYMWDTDPRAGIIPRALSQLFDCLDKAGCEFSVRVSLLEIYNEEIYDLLSHSSELLKMKIYEDNSRKGSVVVSGLTEVHVRDKSDVYDILQQGALKRRTAATNLNEFSSRSHSVFSITVHTKDITQNNMEEEELVKIGKLNLVDLAGSENIGRSGAVDKRAREAGNINQSLLTLGRCITALVDRAPHVPYRESKLTRLLQDSLGGATKTSIIATISPGSDNLEETLSTLDYAARAKNIHNKPRVNQKLTKRALIKEYDDVIEKLRREVVALREKNGVYVDPKTYDEMVTRSETLAAIVKQREEDVEKFEHLFNNASVELAERTERLHILHDDLVQTRKELVEQCCLKDAYIEHAAEVATRASELLVTADIVTSDIDKVHDKVDRVKQVHENNVNTVKSFSGRVKEDVSLLCQGTSGAIEQARSDLKKAQDGLCSIKQEHAEGLEVVSTCVSQLRDAMDEVFKGNDQILLKMSSDLECRSKEHGEVLKDLANDMGTRIEASKENKKKMNDITNSLKSLIDMIKNSSRSHIAKVESYVTSVKKQQDEVEEYIADINSVSSDMMEAQKKTVQELQDDVDKVKELEKSMQKRLASLGIGFEDCHSATVDVGERVKRAVHSRTREICEDMTTHISDVKQSEEQMSKAVVDECIDPSITFAAKSTDIAEGMRQSVLMYSEAGSIALRSVVNEQTDGIVKFKNAFEAASETVLSFKSNSDGLIAGIGEKQNEKVDQVDGAIASVREKLASTEGNVEEAEKSIVNEVDECFDEQFKRVVPTGVTPARKVYSYSSRIPHAPLEEDILTSFRERMLDEDSQEEDNQTEEDESQEDDKSTKSDSGVSGSSSIDPNLNQSITIPDVGGIPFFKKLRKQKAHHAASNSNIPSRLPLRSMQNID